MAQNGGKGESDGEKSEIMGSSFVKALRRTLTADRGTTADKLVKN